MQFVALSHPDGGRSVMKLIEFSPQMRLGIDSGRTTCAALPYQVVVSSSDSKQPVCRASSRKLWRNYVSPGHFTGHVVYPLTNQSTTPCIYPASGTHS
jgi:hypothetical protein